MTNYDKINGIAKDNNGIITATMLKEYGIPSWYLSDLVKKGELERVARGIYCTACGDYDDYYFFQMINGRCIYSFQSALYLHSLTDHIPDHKEATVYSGYKFSHITDDTIVHFVKRDLYTIGITKKQTMFGNTVKVYDKERTICDLIANRKNIDVEIFSHAIKTYAKDPNRNYKKLRAYAKNMRIEKRVDDILEII